MMTDFSISEDLLQAENATRKTALDEDYAALARALGRRGIDADALTRKIMAFGVAIPTWGVGTGGTRFARFPAPASRAICSTSWRIAPPSTIWCGQRRRYRRIFHGTRRVTTLPCGKSPPSTDSRSMP